MIKGIANDTNPNAQLPNTFTGNFISYGKNMTGQQNNITQAIEACHFLHHPVWTAAQSGSNGVIRRTGLLYAVTTFILASLVYSLYLVPSMQLNGSLGWDRLTRLLFKLGTTLVAVFPVIMLENGTTQFMLISTMFPILFAFW